MPLKSVNRRAIWRPVLHRSDELDLLYCLRKAFEMAPT
jgi:hypothetical protein